MKGVTIYYQKRQLHDVISFTKIVWMLSFLFYIIVNLYIKSLFSNSYLIFS